MSPAEIADLLAFAQGYGLPEPEQPQIDAWHHALHQIDYDDAFGAIVDHYRDNSGDVTPADIWGRCRVPEPTAPVIPIRSRRDPGRWHRMWRDALAGAAAAGESRRALVLGCKPPDGDDSRPLAMRLCDEPLGFAHPSQWNGFIPPEFYDGERSNSPRRRALLAIIDDALAAQAREDR